ncbi:MAG: hypothetical protein K1X67_13020 [Fimbriimonadaceae bacterium]|nr:hypothetical protein [Fimbriimonadaceae bacterium]
MSRVIRKAQTHSSGEARDLLAALMATELGAPSKCIWLISPWITDLPILDNSAGTFGPLSSWGNRPATLAEVLVTIATRGTTIVIGTTPDPHNRTFINRIQALGADHRVGSRIKVCIDEGNVLHTKSVVADDYAVVGSMNLTIGGIDVREEYIELKTDQAYVAQARIDCFESFGGRL